MKRIYNALFLGAAMLLASCFNDEGVQLPVNENIVIDLRGDATRVDDNATESYVSHIDIFVFEEDGGQPAAKAYYQRQQVNDSRTLTLGAMRSSFEEGATYFVYLVANSNIDKSLFEEVADYRALLNIKQEDPLLYLSGLSVDDAPKYFLMDAVAQAANGSKGVVINDESSVEELSLVATLRRAAAKIAVTISAGQNVAFKDFSIADGSEGGLYYLRNLPYDAFLLAEAKDDEDIEAKVRTTSKGNTEYFAWDPNSSPKRVTLTAYAYPNHWSNTSLLEHESCIVMNLPMAYTENGETTEYHNNWYKIPMTDDQTLRRNNYYDVNITINRPGASSETKPVNIDNVDFLVEEWTTQVVSVGSEDTPKYLMVNRTQMEMHNTTTDNSTLEFASSSPVTVSIKSIDGQRQIYYYNKYGDKVYENINITGTTNGGIAGNISINTRELPSKNAIRYFVLVVTNEEGLSKEVAVSQSPLVYITNVLSKYSYRSDFISDDPTGTQTADFYENRSRYSRFAVKYTNGKHVCNSGGSESSGYFITKVVSSTNTSGSNKGLSNINHYNANSTPSYRNNYNARMYHIRITSTSSEYVLGRPKITDGKTDPGADNAKMVSPSFMIASRLGSIQLSYVPEVDYSGIEAPNPRDYGANVSNWGGSVSWPNGSDKAGYEAAYAEYEKARLKRAGDTLIPIFAEHAKQYVEVYTDPETGKTVHLNDWRLPTEAELQIIYKFQGSKNDIANADAIDFLLNGDYYMSANGPVYNSNYDTSGYSIRCVRDVY